MLVSPKCKSDTKIEVAIELLNVNVLKRCGVLIFNLFERLKKDGILGNDSICSFSTSMSSCSAGDTYMELNMKKAINELYDMMSHDLEKIDCSYMVPPRQQLYDDLNDFILHDELHQINRYVFGKGPICDDWDSNFTSDLKTIQAWREQFGDKTAIPSTLMEIYTTVADSQKLDPNDIAMIAFAVFCFVLGYDTTVDIDCTYMFCNTGPGFHGEPETSFQRVCNAVSRRVRTFLETAGAPKALAEHFDALAGNPDVMAACSWMFDLLARQPEAVAKIASTDVFAINERLAAGMVAPSYVVLLRVFYKWLSANIYQLLLSDDYQRNRSSWLDDDHEKYLCCLSGISDLDLLFGDVYDGVLRHFTAFLYEYNCPTSTLKTFCDTCDDETFKNIIRFFVNWQIEFYSFSKIFSNTMISDCSDSEIE